MSNAAVLERLVLGLFTLRGGVRLLALLLGFVVLRFLDNGCPGGGVLDGLGVYTYNPLPSCLVVEGLVMLVMTSDTMPDAAVFRCGLTMLTPFLNSGTANLNKLRNNPPSPDPYCVLVPTYPPSSPPACDK